MLKRTCKKLVVFCLLLLLNAPLFSKNNPNDDIVEKVVKLKYGMTLDQILRKEFDDNSEAFKALQAFRRVFNPRKIKAGEEIFFEHTADGTFSHLRYKPEDEYEITVFPDTSGNFIAKMDTLPKIHQTKLVVGEIRTSLYDAVLEQGENPELIMGISDIFQWDIDFFLDPRVGDMFSIIFEKTLILDRSTGLPISSKYGKILAAGYAKSDTTYIAYSYEDAEGRLKYYDANGQSFQKTFLKSPLNYRRISSHFSLARFHPILKRYRGHTGVDFAAQTGTPVVAAADGVVTECGWKGQLGKAVTITHKNGTYKTIYGHLSRFGSEVKVGSRISQNQVIGFVGATGLATGPHLHYTMYYNGRPIDPLKIKPLSGEPIEETDLPAFNMRKKWLEKKLGVTFNGRLDRIFTTWEQQAR